MKWFHQQFLLLCSASGFEFENILLILKVMFLALTDHQRTLTVKIPSKLYKLYKQGLVQAGLRELLNSKIFSSFLTQASYPGHFGYNRILTWVWQVNVYFQNFCSVCLYMTSGFILELQGIGVVFLSNYDMFHPLFVVEPYLRLTHNWIKLGRYHSNSGICKAIVQCHRESEVAKIV